VDVTTRARAAANRGISPNLALDQLVAQRRAQGDSIVHLGFGESRLPVFPALVDRLAAGARRSSYGPVVGDRAVRVAVAGYFDRRRMPTDPAQVVVAPGSKAILMALQLVVPGDVLLPRPSWVTYAPQAELAGKRTWGAAIPPESGGVPAPAALRDAVRSARNSAADPRLLVLTMPDNPTGTTATPALVREVCEIAEKEDLLIVSDEIYRDLLHDPTTPFLSPAEVAPERTVVLTGLSKSLALGGWRIGAARFPTGARGGRLRDRVASVASEIWSALAGPMQTVAEYAFAEPPELRARIAADARLHGLVSQAVHRLFVGAGALNRPPAGGFYCYPDFEPLRTPLASRGVTNSASLQRVLIDQYGIAVLSGHHFGDDEEALRFRAATSMLYGDTESQQFATLRAADPLQISHVSRQLARIGAAMTELNADR
jgi:aspartate aminotransferase